MADKIDMLGPGSVWENRYRVAACIGRGPLVLTYRATDTTTGQQVVVKQMADASPDPLERYAAMRQFEGWIPVLQVLDHVNLCKVYASFQAEGCPCMVEEFVDGQMLDRVVTGPTDRSQALNWMTQLVDVFEYLHSQFPPVVYKALRPSNVMLGTDGRLRLMMMDFALARVTRLRKALRAARPEYSAPEHGMHRDSSLGTDIYELAATIYFVLAGTPPPLSEDRVLRQAPLPSLTDVNATVTADLQDLIYQMMRLRIMDRPSTMAHVRRMLAALEGPL